MTQVPQTFEPTVEDFLRASFENQLAKEVRYTGPVLKGLIGSFGVHSFFGMTLMAIHPLLGLLSLAPVVMGIKAARDSGKRFQELYSESIENPHLWREFVDPNVLTGAEHLLNTPVEKVIEAGMSRGIPRLGKIEPPKIKGAKASRQNSPSRTSGKMDPMKSSTESCTTCAKQTATVSDGTAKGGSEVPGLPRKVAQLDEAAPHLFMVGRTREGKSETLKHLIGREDRVWYLTSKATDKVPSHWRGYRVGGPDLPKQVRWLHSQWEASFLRHLEGTDKQREWFVIDEAVGILQSLKSKGAKGAAESLRGFIVEVLTAGAGVQAFVGILSQTGNAGPIGVDEDLLKNFSIVGCGKRKKSQMLKAFLKLTDLRVTREQEQEILSLDGYWQLWENDGPCLSQVPLSELLVKDVVVCPIPAEDDKQADSSFKSCPQQTEPKSLAERILDHMIKHGEARTAREITIACTRSKDDQRATVEEIKRVLEDLISQEKIYCWVQGTTERYQITGTP